MTEHFKAPEIIQLSRKQMANLSDAPFKMLLIRMLTELVEFGRKLDEKIKAMLTETKETVQRTNSDAKETGTQINLSLIHISEPTRPRPRSRMPSSA